MDEFNKRLDGIEVESNQNILLGNSSLFDPTLSLNENVWDKRPTELQQVFTDCSPYPQLIYETVERM